MARIKINLVFETETQIREDYIVDTIRTLLYEKDEIDNSNITLYWENKNIYVKRLNNGAYKIYFGKTQ
jgi:hypothetical protein